MSKCPHCGAPDIDVDRAVRNLEAYQQGGGSARVAAPCCGHPIIVTTRTVVSVTVDEHPRDTHDDWGKQYSTTPIVKKRRTRKEKSK